MQSSSSSRAAARGICSFRTSTLRNSKTNDRAPRVKTMCHRRTSHDDEALTSPSFAVLGASRAHATVPAGAQGPPPRSCTDSDHQLHGFWPCFRVRTLFVGLGSEISTPVSYCSIVSCRGQILEAGECGKLCEEDTLRFALARSSSNPERCGIHPPGS